MVKAISILALFVCCFFFLCFLSLFLVLVVVGGGFLVLVVGFVCFLFCFVFILRAAFFKLVYFQYR